MTAATDTRDRAIDEEQTYLDMSEARRLALVEELAAATATPARDAAEHHHKHLLRARLRALDAADGGLVLGRIDTAAGATHRIGRVGVPAAEGEPLVLDWRAEAARPFYTATALEPQGLLRRRHIRTEGTTVVGVDDEDLTGRGTTPEDGLVGEAALLAALDERRTGAMGTAVATLQREQDAIVRAPSDVPLVVQGGPGTGKTVVALHRVAYLLFTQPEAARRGVLVLGPSRRFLDYVAQVLPALGETAVVSATCDTLVPGVAPERDEAREVAEIKGRAVWRDAITAHLASLLPRPCDIALPVDGDFYVVPEARVARALRSALAGDRSHAQSRLLALEALHEALVDVVAEHNAQLVASMEEGLEDVLAGVDASLARRDDRGVRTGARGSDVDGVLSDGDLEDLRERVTTDPAVAAVLDSWWPVLHARTVLQDLLRSPATLAELLPSLTAAEVAAVAAEPEPFAPSDIPLLDTVQAVLGTDARADGEDLFLADRATADPGWTYGHAVVDEAQELSAMQWHMVLRRVPTRSITAVGDVDQSGAPHRHRSWAAILTPLLGEAWRQAELTICYRTPREVMTIVAPVLERAGSTNEPPRAVRSSGHPARVADTPVERVATTVAALVGELRDRYAGGTVGVVAPAAWHARLRSASSGDGDVPVLAAVEAKGLEWDATIVVDPDAIAAEPRGWNALYVALTRCTQELVQIRPH